MFPLNMANLGWFALPLVIVNDRLVVKAGAGLEFPAKIR